MTCVLEATPFTLQQPIQFTYSLLQNFATTPEFIPTLETVFGENLNPSVILTLAQDWRRGNFQDLPHITVCPTTQMNGAMGQFVKASHTIFLSEDFISFFSYDPEIITTILLEEIGNYLSSYHSDAESEEHQGAIFADIVQGYFFRQFSE